MTLTELAKDIKEKGAEGVGRVKFIGRAKPVLDFIALLNDTVDFNPSDDYWQTYGEYHSLLGGYRAISH